MLDFSGNGSGLAMTTQIWKYELRGRGVSTRTMPIGARIVSLEIQNDIPCIWAIVEPGNPLQTREFCIVGTGWDIQIPNYTYVGMYQTRSFDWHVLEVLKS